MTSASKAQKQSYERKRLVKNPQIPDNKFWTFYAKQTQFTKCQNKPNLTPDKGLWK